MAAAHVRAGSIPACAGEPNRPHLCCRIDGVYPRVCGGTSVAGVKRWADYGLSPRVRGNPSTTMGSHSLARSIPACAGEPHPSRSPHRRKRVYPRVCGGTPISSGLASRSIGLSPRVRGNRYVETSIRADEGSIPACAGEPPTPRPSHYRSPVYPRVCGGTQTQPAMRVGGDGLSPRVRGNPGDLNQHLAPFGSIPACAGEPRSVSSSAHS